MRTLKLYAWALIGVLSIQIIFPTASWALTGGPSQPEFQAFTPVGTSEMVDLPSGDFVYNIPLMDVGGYPLNLAYNSGITAEQEASMVGLGWSLNPGAINRNVRAIPDDFKGEDDAITKEYSIKPNQTISVGIKALEKEYFGNDPAKLKKLAEASKAQQNLAKFNLGFAIKHNNYKGFGYKFGLSPKLKSDNYDQLSAKLDVGFDSSSGITGGASIMHEKDGSTFKGSLGLKIHSREGISSIVVEGGLNHGSNKSTLSSLQSTIDFVGKSFSPEIGMPMNNLSLDFKFKPEGLALFGGHAGAAFKGSFAQQKLRQNQVTKPAYGLLYGHEGNNDVHAILDFSREKDAPFHEYSSHLPIVNAGNDILSVTGQGMAGSFQLKRSDVPMFHDVKKTQTSNGGNIGIETGKGSLLHIGLDLGYNNSNSFTQKWEQNNSLLNNYNFKSNGNALYEPAYYKSAGEMSVESDSKYLKEIGGVEVVKPQLGYSSDSKITSTGFLLDKNESQITDIVSSSTPSAPSPKRITRERRNKAISYLTAKEASLSGIEKQIVLKKENEFLFNSNLPAENRVSSNIGKRQHHISQVESVREDGMRYVYGIPAYNFIKKDVAFNATGLYPKCDHGNVAYTPGVDNSINNDRGDDNYFNEVSTPAYAHSYLLTAVLSQDYEDVKGDGPTEDDFGSYTKFNYTRAASHDNPYKWRSTIEENQASFNPGLYSKKDDNKASYAYGEKELYFVHSIESKTMIAEFTYGERKDAYGVKGEDGGLSNENQNRILQKITLYSKADRRGNERQATPIKTVHFVYDYGLCPGTPNSKANGGGKLTLNEVYFTYGNSKKGRFSSYKFKYKNASKPYQYRAFDRWGSYKPNDVLGTSFNCQNPARFSEISNEEFPYAEQSLSKLSGREGTWCLNQIQLPSGGEINVEYGHKHYAHVQDRHAMEMIPITGVNELGKFQLYDINPITGSGNFLKMFFEDRGGSVADYFKGFNKEKDHLFLRCLVKMNSLTGSKEKWEYVDVFCKIKGYGKELGNFFVELEPMEGDKNQKLHPITKWSFQFIRQNLPDLVYGKGTFKIEKIKDIPKVVKPLASMYTQMANIAVGVNNVMKTRGFAKEIDLTRSHIRLTSPDGVKYGGGSMVKRITIKDNWSKMVGSGNGDNSTYGQEYSYMTEENGKKISSGVASYEPLIGGDENPFRELDAIEVDKKLIAVDDVYFAVKPYGEGLMPSAQIVFSEIKVENLNHADVKRTDTGHSVMKFYTAKDFPTILEESSLKPIEKKSGFLLRALGIYDKYQKGVSQGFLVKKNNMHGQSESKEVYDENGELISKVTYHYKRKGNQLENRVNVLNHDGTVTEEQIGTDIQLVGDSRESKGITHMGSLDFNVEGFYVGPIPVPFLIPLPQYGYDEKQFKSMSMTKVVDQYGVLEKVVAYDLGSEITTQNVMWDAETGEVLLTQTENEYEDPIYNLKIPAHLAYEGMAGAYKNLGLKANLSSMAQQGVYSTTSAKYFLPGDELYLENASENSGWILHVDGNSNQVFIIDRFGVPISSNGNIKVKVIRSGHRNMPASSIGSITSKENPIQNGNLVLNKDTEALNAGAVEYSDEWQSYVKECATGNCDYSNSQDIFTNCPVNPFVNNIRGNWKPKKSWLQLQERYKDKDDLLASSSTNIREDGIYQDFTPFWDANSGQSWDSNTSNWTWTTEVTKFNPNGTELENMDVLKRHSCEIVGYFDQLITGVAANAEFEQIAFDGFEDYRYNHELDSLCPIHRHFGAEFEVDDVTKKTAHTGKYSLQVPQNDSKGLIISLKDQNTYQANNFMHPYYWQDKDWVRPFTPKPGKYVVSAWVKEGDGLGYTNYIKHALELRTNSNSPVVFKASGMIIDGWQRIEGVIDIPNNATQLSIEFKSLSGETVFFDDFRIFPFDGDMKSFVYDDISLKLLAELDANGYATFYEYDPSGELIRIKKETERGIMTIQESRSAQPKN